jgi:hypothetical protein
MDFRKQLYVDKIITEWRPPEVNYSRPSETLVAAIAPCFMTVDSASGI